MESLERGPRRTKPSNEQSKPRVIFSDECGFFKRCQLREQFCSTTSLTTSSGHCPFLPLSSPFPPPALTCLVRLEAAAKVVLKGRRGLLEDEVEPACLVAHLHDRADESQTK